jgi:hypothetical protein
MIGHKMRTPSRRRASHGLVSLAISDHGTARPRIVLHGLTSSQFIDRRDIRSVLSARRWSKGQLAITIVEAVLDLTVGSSTDKLVLLVLADLADKDTRRCWPSNGYLCAKTELSERAVSLSIARLESAGHIAVTRRHRRGSIFTIHPIAQSKAVDKPVDNFMRQIPLTARGAVLTALGTVLTARGAVQPVKDPSLNLLRKIPLETVVDKIKSKKGSGA